MLASLFLLVAMSTVTPPPVAQGLRAPQVAVLGTTLHDRLVTRGEAIDVAGAQLDAEMVMSDVPNGMFTLRIELVATGSQYEVGLYDGHAAVPTKIPMFPTHATASWFVVLQCQVEPVRLVVTLFDDNSMFQSSTMYPRGDRTGIGFYLQGPEGTFYTQDTRNPGASPQALFYRGSGENAGQLWLAFEDCAPQRGSDRDFDDVVLFIENRPSDVLPVEATTWGRLKARFR